MEGCGETKGTARNAPRGKWIGGTERRDRKNKKGTRTGQGDPERHRKKEAQRDKTNEQVIQLREQRRALEKDIAMAMKKAETSTNKAAPPPEAETNGPPLNLLGAPIKSVQISQDDESS